MNIAGRRTVSLDGQWKTIVDQYETGYYDYRRNPINERASFFADASFDADRTKLVEYEFDAARELRVPGDWNTQRADLYRYEGTVWYRTKFDAPDIEGRAFVYFGASNYETVVGINGHVLGTHLGGFTPFNYEVTGLLREGDNSLIAKVDNKRMLDAVPKQAGCNQAPLPLNKGCNGSSRISFASFRARRLLPRSGRGQCPPL